MYLRLDTTVAKYVTIHEKVQVIKELFNGNFSARSGYIGAWAEEVLRSVARDTSNVEERDGTALAEIAVCLQEEIALVNMYVDRELPKLSLDANLYCKHCADLPALPTGHPLRTCFHSILD